VSKMEAMDRKKATANFKGEGAARAGRVRLGQNHRPT
jgi:hypothetical protein